MVKVHSLFATFLTLFILVSYVGAAVVWSGVYHLDNEWVKIWINQNGTIDLFYNITLTLDSGDNINYITVGQPKADFTIGETIDQYGNNLSATDASQGSDYKVKVTLQSPLQAGQTIWFTLTTKVAHMLYNDTQNPGNVGMQFIPTWYNANIQDLRVSIVLPPNVTADMVRTSINWTNTFPEDGQHVVYWEKHELSPNEQFQVGISFPKEHEEDLTLTPDAYTCTGDLDKLATPCQNAVDGDWNTKLAWNNSLIGDSSLIIAENYSLQLPANVSWKFKAHHYVSGGSLLPTPMKAECWNGSSWIDLYEMDDQDHVNEEFNETINIPKISVSDKITIRVTIRYSSHVAGAIPPNDPEQMLHYVEFFEGELTEHVIRANVQNYDDTGPPDNGSSGGFPSSLFLFIPYVIGFLFVGAFIVIVGVGIYAASKKQYMLPQISMETLGIKHGLTAVEASYLLDLKPTKIVTEILYSLLKKRAVWVEATKPSIRLKIMPEFQNRTGPTEDPLRHYEIDFLNAIKEDGRLNEEKLAGTIMSLRDNVEEKMRGYCRRDTIDYYNNIVTKAWRQVEQAGTPELASNAYDEQLLWLLLDPNVQVRTQTAFHDRAFEPNPLWLWYWYGYTHYYPHPTYQPSTQVPTPSAKPPTIPGADFANNVATSLESTANNIVVNIEKFANSIIPAPPSKASNEPTHHNATCVCACHACACACACVSCACACAGGGVG